MSGTFHTFKVRDSILVRLGQHRRQSPLRPLPLGQLYHDICRVEPGTTLGQFHDCLRDLQGAGKIRLSPFTGAMYALQDGECCLILGHEVIGFCEATASQAA